MNSVWPTLRLTREQIDKILTARIFRPLEPGIPKTINLVTYKLEDKP